MYETSCQSRFDARYWMLGAGALGRPRGMVWGGRREEDLGWGTHVHLWWIHFDIWQNQYNIVKFKKKKKKRNVFERKKKKKKKETTTDKGVFLSSVCCSLMEGGVCSLRAPSREQKHHSDFSPHFSAGTDALWLWGVYFGVNAVPLI